MNRESLKHVVFVMRILVGGVWLCALSGCHDRKVEVSYDRVPEIWSKTLHEGVGMPVVVGKHVDLHYTVALEDGRVLIDTRANREPHRMIVGDWTVIEGLDLGVRGMRLGGMRRLVIPPELGYGRAGYGDGVVPANAKLIIEVELVGVN